MAHAKVVVVTGGSKGLGLAVAENLLACGYRIATCSRHRSKEATELERRHNGTRRFCWFQCELGREDEENRFFEEVLAWRGEDPLYGLINNAAIAGEGILATFPNVDTEHLLAVNLTSAIRMSRLALRVMLTQNSGGRLVNVSSIVGIRGYTGLAVYSACKAGLDGLTRSLAREVGRRGITVNSIAPGYLKTDLSASLRPEQQKQIQNRTPLGRMGTVGDIVPAIQFLLSEGAAFITGQTIVIDGGITC